MNFQTMEHIYRRMDELSRVARDVMLRQAGDRMAIVWFDVAAQRFELENFDITKPPDTADVAAAPRTPSMLDVLAWVTPETAPVKDLEGPTVAGTTATATCVHCEATVYGVYFEEDHAPTCPWLGARALLKEYGR